MRTSRFFCKSITEHAILDEVESNHISRVLRLGEGDGVELFDGQGTLAEGVIESLSRKQVTIHCRRISQSPAPPTGRIILAVSFAKGHRFDWLIEKCTELGVDHIAAVQFERTVKLGKSTAMDRYRKNSITAAKQSGQLFLPTISGPVKLAATLDFLKSTYPQSTLLYGDPSGRAFSDRPVQPHPTDTIVIIGPEGGLSDNEITFLTEQQAHGVSVNRNILRIETAAVAFCSLLSSQRLD